MEEFAIDWSVVQSVGGVAVASPVVVESVVVLPVAGSAPSIGRVCGGVLLAAANLISCAQPPPPFIWHCAMGAHQPC